MKSFFVAGIFGIIAVGCGTILGGLLSSLLKGSSQKYTPSIFSFCSGLILGLITLDIIPESIEMGGWLSTSIGLVLGIFLFQYIHKINRIISLNTKNRSVSTGVIMATGIALHNFPTGFAFGASTDTLASSMLTTMILHTIPEGIAVFTPFFATGVYSIRMILPVAFIISMPMGVGATLGNMVGLKMTWLLSMIIGISMAIIILVTMLEIMGDALKKGPLFLCLSQTVIGFLVILFFL